MPAFAAFLLAFAVLFIVAHNESDDASPASSPAVAEQAGSQSAAPAIVSQNTDADNHPIARAEAVEHADPLAAEGSAPAPKGFHLQLGWLRTDFDGNIHLGLIDGDSLSLNDSRSGFSFPRPSNLGSPDTAIASQLAPVSGGGGSPSSPQQITATTTNAVWNGGGADDNWNTTGNWVGGSNPTGGNATTQIHFAGSTRLTPNNDYGAFTQEGEIIFDAGASSFTLGGNAIKLSSKIENLSTNLQTYNQTGLSLIGGVAGALTTNPELDPTNGDLTIGSAGNIFVDNNVAGTTTQVDVFGSHVLTLNAALKDGNGPGKLVIQGPATVIFNGANTYTGGTFINNGALQFGSTGSLTSSQVLTLGNNNGGNNATLSINTVGGGTTVANPITVRAGSTGTKTISGLNNAGTNTFSGVVTLNTDFSSSSAGGTGVLDFTNTVTSTGGSGVAQTMTVTGGTVQLSGNADNVNLGVVLNTGGTLNLNKASSSTVHAFGNSSTINLGGTLKLTGTGGDQIFNSASLAINGTFDLNALSETINALSGSGTVTNNAAGTSTLTVGGSANGTFSGTIQDGGATKVMALLKNGSGNLTLSGPNSYTGGTTWGSSGGGAGGILTFGSSSIGGPGSITSGPLGTGTFTMSNTSATTGSNFMQSSDSTTRTISNGIAFNGTGLNFNFGGTGDLVFDGAVALGTTSATRTFAVNNTNTTFSGTISGTGLISLAKAGTGTLILSGTNSYNGSTAINAGTLSINSIKNINTNSAIGAPTTAANGTVAIGTGATAATLKYTGTGDSTNRVIDLAGTTGGAILDESGTNALTFTSDFTATGAGSKTLTLQGSTAGVGVISGKIVDNSVTNTTSLLKLGSGTWTLSGANTYTGTTTIGSIAATGGTLKLGLVNALPTTTSLIFLGGAVTPSTLDLSGFSQTVGSLSDGSTASGTLTNSGAAAIFTLNNTDSNFFFGSVTGALTFNKLGAGTEDIGGANTFSGGSTIKAGTIVISNTAAASGATSGPLGPSMTAVVLGDTTGSSNANLLLGRTSQNTGGYTLSNNITVQDGNSGIMTLGTQNTAGTNTFSGNVTLGSTTNTGKSLTLSAAAGSELDLTGNILANGASTAALTIAGGGTVKLSGTNTYTGLTTVSNASALDITNSSALGTSANGTTVNNASALWLENNVNITAEALTLNGDGIATNGALRSVTGNNTYGGAITLASAARIHSSLGSTLALTGGINDAGFRLTVSGTGDTTLSGVGVSGTGGDLLKQGSGAFNLNVASGFSGSSAGANNVFIDEGTISVGVTGALGTTNGTTTGLINMGSSNTAGLNTTLNIANNSVTLANPIDVRFLQTGGKVISGTFTSGSSTYSGGITLHDNVTLAAANGGTLLFSGVIATGGSGTNATPPTGGFNTGPGVIINSGASSTGIVEYDNAMTYTGDTVVNSGTLQFNGNGSLANSTIRLGNLGAATLSLNAATGGSLPVTINVRSSAGTKTISANNTSGTSTLGGHLALDDDATVLEGSSTGILALTQARSSASDTLTGTDIKNHVLTVTGSGNTIFGTTNTTFGTIYNSGVGGGSILKTGSGTLTFNDQNTYTGGTTVNVGALMVNNTSGSGVGTGAVSVSNSGTTLGGTGIIGGATTINSGAILLGGTGAAASGALTVANNLTLSSGSVIELALGGLAAHSSLARTAGTWAFQTNQLFNFLDLGATATTYDNIISGLASDPGSEGTWTIQNAGWIGTFTYDGMGGPGNIDLTLSAVPEPGTWASSILTLAVIGYSARRNFRRRYSLSVNR